MLDWQDRAEILIDLESGYAENGAMAAARTADGIIAAAVAGTAFQGNQGQTASPFNTTGITSATAATTLGNVLAAGGTGLTYAKAREARAILNAREVGVDDLGMRDRNAFVWLVNAGAMSQLMNETQAISKDFIEGSPLTEGAIIYFMGFNFVIYNALVNTTGTTYRTLLWHRDAVGYAIWKERDLRIDQLPEHNYSTAVTYMTSMGAVRIQDKGVIAVDVVL
jgi:Phage capsid protein